MSRFSLEAKVGALFLVCIAILVYAALRVVHIDMAKGFELSARFRSVEGLSDGSQVQIAGIRVGKVKEIRFDSDTGKAIVVMDIMRDYENSVSEGSSVMLKTRGLLGDKYVVIVPGKPNQRKLKNGEEITLVHQAPDTEDALENIGIAAQDLQVLARAAREELIDQHGRTKVSNTITDANQLFKDMREIVSKNKDSINQTLNKMDSTTTNLDQVVARNKEKVNQSMDRMETFSRSINQTGDKLKKLTGEWDNITLEVRSGKGTLGKLIADETLHQEARALVRDARQVTNRIQYGQGTVSRLINDPELYYEARRAVRNMNKTAEDVSEATPISTLAIILGSVLR